MIKILIGGSPCTYWSIAKKNREVEAEGIGWELFRNYLIAKDKFKPDLFLYENNKSAAQAIKDQISRELGVELVHINSSLVSAQNRQRFYAFNRNIVQPEDRGILLKDILENRHTMISELVENVGECATVQRAIPEIADKVGYVPEMFNAYNRQEITDKAPTLSTGSMVTSSCAVTRFEKVKKMIGTVYEVMDGQIEIKGSKYPIKLPDGFYILRKMTPIECERLQTLPDNYTAAVSNSQRYKVLGNGWTAEIIIHILSGALNDVPRGEEIVVLSMYDGIGTGRYCLDKMGFTNVTYYAYEIDKPAMKVALSNYPDIIQLGDAFDIRCDDWELGKKFSSNRGRQP